jgi:hypothetical protein
MIFTRTAEKREKGTGKRNDLTSSSSWKIELKLLVVITQAPANQACLRG